MVQTALRDSLRGIEAEIAAGRHEQALTLCQDVQTRYPRALSVQRTLGEVYLALRKTREALGALDRALAGNPEDARACCARAIIHQIHGDPRAALAWYRRACDISPDDATLRVAYRELAHTLGAPAYRPTRMGLARLYLRGDLFPHAIREWETLLAEQPDSLEAQLGLAETLWRARHAREAEEQCRRILVNAASCVKAMLILVALEHDAGNVEEAQRLVRRAFELDPDQGIARTLFAERFAAGDHALRTLALGEEQPAAPTRRTGPLSLPSLVPSSPGTHGPAMRPFSRSRPLSQPLAQPVPEQQQRHLTYPAAAAPSVQQPPQPPIPMAPQSPQPPMTPSAQPPVAPRPSALPDDFHKIFDETKNMLWDGDDPEDEARSRMGALDGRQRPARVEPQNMGAPVDPAAAERGHVDPFARSSLFVPPVLRAQGANFDETEARAAINWIQWLQAQGARQREDAQRQTSAPFPQSGRPVTGTMGPQTQGAREWGGGQQAAPVRGGASGYLAATGAPTGPLPQATPEQLRAMFAELEDTSVRRVVDGAIIESQASRESVARPSAEAPRVEEKAPLPVNDVIAERVADPQVEDAPLQHDAPQTLAHHSAAEDESLRGPDTEARAAGWSVSGPLPEDLARLYDVAPTRGENTRAEVDESADSAAQNGAFAASGMYHIGEIPTEELALPSLPTQVAPARESDIAPPAPASSYVTLEALERKFETSGFQRVELRPGELSTLLPEPEQGEDAMLAPSRDVEEQRAHAVNDAAEDLNRVRESASASASAHEDADVEMEHAPTRGAEAGDVVPVVPVMTPEPAPPAHDDYPARLARARQRRSEGNLDEALVEYRAILKNAPDLLPEVIGDLSESMEDAPDHPELHRLLGDASIHQGDYLSALESYNRAVSLTQANED